MSKIKTQTIRHDATHGVRYLCGADRISFLRKILAFWAEESGLPIGEESTSPEEPSTTTYEIVDLYIKDTINNKRIGALSITGASFSTINLYVAQYDGTLHGSTYMSIACTFSGGSSSSSYTNAYVYTTLKSISNGTAFFWGVSSSPLSSIRNCITYLCKAGETDNNAHYSVIFLYRDQYNHYITTAVQDLAETNIVASATPSHRRADPNTGAFELLPIWYQGTNLYFKDVYFCNKYNSNVYEKAVETDIGTFILFSGSADETSYNNLTYSVRNICGDITNAPEIL